VTLLSSDALREWVEAIAGVRGGVDVDRPRWGADLSVVPFVDAAELTKLHGNAW
jgi:hypothetical protein